jgi:hypothetical protein
VGNVLTTRNEDGSGHVAGAIAEEIWWFGRRERIETIVATVCTAISDGQPLSIIRLGDGEGTAMHQPTRGEKELESSYSTWFGEQYLSQAELGDIRDRLHVACANANILGLPSRFQYNVREQYGRVFRALKGWELPKQHQILADANLHWYLQFSGAMIRILQARAIVGVIGCRDIETRLKSSFEVRRVRTWIVRGESQFPGTEGEPHWPDGFCRVMESLEVTEPGQPFLIGAGGLGKIYCHRVKQLGGVAIDVGSLLDAWAGVESRLRFPRFPELFSIDHHTRLATTDLRAALTAACEEADIKHAVF